MAARRVLVRSLWMLVLVWLPVPGWAQTPDPGPPGPYVFDVRLATSGVPGAESLHPELAAGATVPTRGFGGGVGGHVYAIRIGPARVGVGADLLIARGSTADARTTLRTVAPQISFNFGTSDGWSYLSAGVGAARVSTGSGVFDAVRSINYGGGARWFLRRHLGVGFDVRVHQMEAGESTPKATAVSAAIGVSVK